MKQGGRLSLKHNWIGGYRPFRLMISALQIVLQPQRHSSP